MAGSPFQAAHNKGTAESMGKRDVSDRLSFRGAGACWRAGFGSPLDATDLLFAVRREPVAHRIVFQVAHDVFDNWFRVEEVAEKPDPRFNDDVQRVLDGLDAKNVFTTAAVYERLFGWAIIAMTLVDYGGGISEPVKKPREVRELIPYSSLQCTVLESDEDMNPESSRYGLPVYYTLRRRGGEQVKLHYSRAIHIATRLLDHPYRGVSVLEPVYDDLTVWRNMRYNMGETFVRYGSGFPDISVENASKGDLDKLEQSDMFQHLQARSYFLHSDKVKLEFKGAQGRALDPEPYCDAILESISAGSGVPMAVLRGAQAGTLAGSEVNEREYFKLISDLQSRFEPALYKLLDVLIECGQIRFRYGVRRDYRIIWQSAFELPEQTKAQVELQLAQARSLKSSWLTVDELRKMEGAEPLADGEGTVVLGLKRLEMKGADAAVEASGLHAVSPLHKKAAGTEKE